MPDGNGKLYFVDFKTELKNRGFDGYSDDDLGRYVNWGYFNVARKSRWSWEQAEDTFTLAPGSTSVVLGTELPNFRSLDYLYVTTANQRRKLTPLSDREFFEQWYPLDLTSTSSQGEPDSYFIWQNKLFILPPPSASRDFRALYHQRVTYLVNPNDQPLTPMHLDEAVLDAALVRAHERANELDLKREHQVNLEDFFDDMRDDEEELMDEQPSRVRPDDSWL